MSGKPSYLAAAFNARPFGMPLPLNWFALATFALLGTFVSAGFWLIGAGLEGFYLWGLSRNPRFRAIVDARGGETQPDVRYHSIIAHLDEPARASQAAIEKQSLEIVELLRRAGATESQIEDVRQMAWLHLKLLAARTSMLAVIETAGRDSHNLDEQEQRLGERLSKDDVDDGLRHSLEQQLQVIQSRRQTHADAQRRRELVEAELDRLRQQVSLVREQALLATDERSVAASLDGLSASLNEANRWLKEQRELFTVLDDLTDAAPPPELLRSPAPSPKAKTRQKMSEQERDP